MGWRFSNEVRNQSTYLFHRGIRSYRRFCLCTTAYPQPVTTNFALQNTIVNPLIKLKVGWSTWIGMEGSRVVLVSGEGVVRLEPSGRVVGLQPGKATVYNYAANGTLFINHIEVTY